MKQAFLFPGQGSQSLGMGTNLYQEFQIAKRVFEEVDDTLGQNLFKIMTEGPEDQLKLTENAQVAIMAVSVAAARVYENEIGHLHTKGEIVVGHSLGEYSALTATRSLSLHDAALLLKKRGQSMQEAVPLGVGGMVAVLGLELEQVEDICRSLQKYGVCQIANDNAPGQIVVSGHQKAMEMFTEQAKAKGAKRLVPLEVSAPFHCALMKPATEEMRLPLQYASFKIPVLNLLSNISVKQEDNPESLKQLLIDQIEGRIRFRECGLKLQNLGITRTVELGHGKILSGLMKRIYPVETVSIGSSNCLKNYLNQ
jgi:[acyl-carrier-protein] S-malonyltransferase